MDDLDPRRAFLMDVDSKETRIVFSGEPIVLLCGGQAPADTNKGDLSLRHALRKADLPYKVYCPENFDTWQTDSSFDNLMELEKELAAICSAVLIVVESPGSIAELGAFSQLPELSDRLLVITPQAFNDSKSFINLGILKYLGNQGSPTLLSYPWEAPKGRKKYISVTSDVLADIADSIGKNLHHRLRTASGSEGLKSDKNSHVIVLMHSLIKLFKILKQSEVITYLKRFGISLTHKEFISKTSMLISFGLLEKKRYGDSDFYLTTRQQFHDVQLSPRNGRYLDRLRAKIQTIEFYSRTPSHKHRLSELKKSIGADA